MKNINGYSPNQLVFGRNPNFPTVENNDLPALNNSTTSEIVASNLNAMHFARKNYVANESSNRLKRAMKHVIRSYTDVIYQTGDLL